MKWENILIKKKSQQWRLCSLKTVTGKLTIRRGLKISHFFLMKEFKCLINIKLYFIESSRMGPEISWS